MPIERCLARCLFGFLLGSAACQGSDMTPPVDMPPFSADAVVLTIGPVDIAPGEEKTVCITALLPTTTPIDVVQIDTRQSFTHHVIFYRESDDAPVDTTPTPCPPLDILSSNRAPLFIGETPDATMKLPTGVAYHLDTAAPYRIEAHILNATPDAAQSTAMIALTPAPPGSQMTQADMVFLNAATPLYKSYDGLHEGLPPGVVTTIDPMFFGIPDDLIDSKFFAITSHQHHLGTDFVISKSTDISIEGTKLFENKDWQHPILQMYPEDAPLTFARGEGFRWVCTYNNTLTSYVKFGQSAQTDEMCILWGYYYPSQGFRVLFL